MTQFLITKMTIVKRILFGFCNPQKILYVANSFSLQSFAKLSLVSHRIEASIMTNGFYCFFLLQFRMRLIFFLSVSRKGTGVRNSLPPTQMDNVDLRKHERNIKKVLFVSSQCNSHQIKFTVLKKALTENFNMNFVLNIQIIPFSRLFMDSTQIILLLY